MTIPFSKKLKKLLAIKKKIVGHVAKIALWFSLGAFVGFFFFVSFLYISYKQNHTHVIYEGVMVNGVDFGGKTEQELKHYFAKRNHDIHNTKVTVTDHDAIATISASQIAFGYDETLLADQAMSVGRSNNLLSNMSLMLQAYLTGVQLSPAYHYKEDILDRILKPLQTAIDVKPVDALFQFENGRVVTFRLASDGKAVDTKKLKEQIIAAFLSALLSDTQQQMHLRIPIVASKPTITNDKANNLGITELIAEGTSLFQHSIENRIFNINLAATRLNGVLIPAGQTFSFTKTVGDVSAFTGYKQAYVIENGKTVLGDGGGLCQVSTTLFRAALNAGLPIVERHAHAYRVGYYEEDSPPGVDAAVYSPTVDMKFKNDTGNAILVQSYVDQNEQRLTFDLYGTRDSRETIITQPVILSESPAPESRYQDDPTLPKGQVKQVDFAAGGANVSFTRTVKQNGKIVLSDKFVSNYRPWQAVYLRGTKE